MGQTFQHCSQPSFINQWSTIQHLLQVPVNHERDAPSTLSKTQKAIGQLSNGKVPRADAIPAVVYKYGGPVLCQKLVDIFQSIWQQGTVPQDFNALIIHLYKRKGNCQQCDNHCGISLLSITGKVLARVLLNHLTMHLGKGLLWESQCGFWAGQGTVDMIFAARQLHKKCQEQRCNLYTTFVDLTKDFDNGDILEAFAVTNRVKQGCVLAPILFCLMFSAMLQDAFHHSGDRICIIYWTDGKLHNQCHLKAVTEVKQTVIRDFLFVDDCALNAPVSTTCRTAWTDSPQFVTILVSPLAQKNWGYVPTSSWQTLSQTSHNCRWQC